MKKLIVTFFVICLISVIGAFALTDPKVQRRIEQERQAKKQAEQAKQKEWEDGWKKWYEDAKKKNAAKADEPREPGFDQGFQFGFMGGKLTRSKTNIAISSKQIEALAMEQLDKQSVPAESHAGFVRGFTAGWSFGWTSK